MRKSTILLFCLACFVISMTLGCKDKKPEVEPPVVVVDTMEIVDTVPQVVIDTVPETARDSLISATPVPKAADELFDDFLFLFTANKKLQYERVDFPLPVFEGDSQSKIEKKDWKMERFFSEQEFYTLILDDESQLELPKDTTIDSVVVEKILLRAKTVEQHVFNRNNGQWRLTGINRNTMFQNQNKSFLAFYERFASDSIFQQQSIHDPVEAVLPDPDDDYAMMEGEFHPEQWDEFKPFFLPSDTISNVIYGQAFKAETFHHQRARQRLRDRDDFQADGWKVDACENCRISKHMKDYEHFNLIEHNTFGINATCRRFVEFDNEEEVTPFLCSLTDNDLPLLILGAGSNLLLTKDFDGTVLHSAIKGVESKCTSPAVPGRRGMISWPCASTMDGMAWRTSRTSLEKWGPPPCRTSGPTEWKSRTSSGASMPSRCPQG